MKGFNNQFGWHAYLVYEKVKTHKGFLNHIVRKSLYKIWFKYKYLLEPKIPLWTSPTEALTVKKKNMKAEWATYRMLLEENNNKLIFKK